MTTSKSEILSFITSSSFLILIIYNVKVKSRNNRYFFKKYLMYFIRGIGNIKIGKTRIFRMLSIDFWHFQNICQKFIQKQDTRIYQKIYLCSILHCTVCKIVKNTAKKYQSIYYSYGFIRICVFFRDSSSLCL